MAMNWKNLSALVLSALLNCVLFGPSHADFVLSFGRDGSLGATEFVVEPGSQVSIDVYLVEKTGNRLHDEGVGSMLFDLEIIGEGISHVSPGGFLLGIDSFSLSTNLLDLNPAVRKVDLLTEVVDGGLAPVRSAPGVSHLLLGTVIMEIDPEFIDTTLLSGNPGDVFALTLGTSPINTVSLGGATATITAVPEPGSMAGLALLVIGGVVAHRRRVVAGRPGRTAANS